jgi:SP family general alpha glucoside:H+ symporter-like MFS transporter
MLSRQFIAAFCAYVVGFGDVLGNSFLKSHASEPEAGKQLLDAALSVQVPERISSPSPQAIFISFFLYGAYASLGDYRHGWFYLREATTLFILHRESNGSSWYSPAIQGRTFWVLVISERFVIRLTPACTTNSE